MRKEHKDSRPLLLGEPITFHKAAEPGNIIWETKHIRGKALYKRLLLVVLLLTFILTATFTSVIKIKSFSINLSKAHGSMSYSLVFNFITLAINYFIKVLIIYIMEKVGGETQT